MANTQVVESIPATLNCKAQPEVDVLGQAAAYMYKALAVCTAAQTLSTPLRILQVSAAHLQDNLQQIHYNLQHIVPSIGNA